MNFGATSNFTLGGYDGLLSDRKTRAAIAESLDGKSKRARSVDGLFERARKDAIREVKKNRDHSRLFPCCD
jgi:hypothetical protein